MAYQVMSLSYSSFISGHWIHFSGIILSVTGLFCTFASVRICHWIMRGLKRYIRRHGRHFTEELALHATGGSWNSSRVLKKASGMVYYNVTGSTVGDMVFLANLPKDSGLPFSRTLQGCIKFALSIIGDYSFHDGRVFDRWTLENKDFDFTPFI